MDKLLAGKGGTISVINYDSSGVPADAGAGNGTVAVADGAGVAIAGSPFTATHGAGGSGLYSATIPSSLGVLEVYTATWTFPDASTTITQFELVGTVLYTIADFRNFDPALANATTYPASLVRDVREVVEDVFEQSNVSATRRGARDLLDGTGTGRIMLFHRRVLRVVAVTTIVPGSPPTRYPFTATQLAQLSWTLTGELTWYPGGVFVPGFQNIEVLYEYGYASVPAPLERAGKYLGRDLIVKGAYDDLGRASSMQTDLGLVRFTLADATHPTGIPDVDAELRRYQDPLLLA